MIAAAICCMKALAASSEAVELDVLSVPLVVLDVAVLDDVLPDDASAPGGGPGGGPDGGPWTPLVLPEDERSEAIASRSLSSVLVRSLLDELDVEDEVPEVVPELLVEDVLSVVPLLVDPSPLFRSASRAFRSSSRLPEELVELLPVLLVPLVLLVLPDAPGGGPGGGPDGGPSTPPDVVPLLVSASDDSICIRLSLSVGVVDAVPAVPPEVVEDVLVALVLELASVDCDCAARFAASSAHWSL